jgi:hypothetical protein
MSHYQYPWAQEQLPSHYTDLSQHYSHWSNFDHKGPEVMPSSPKSLTMLFLLPLLLLLPGLLVAPLQEPSVACLEPKPKCSSFASVVSLQIHSGE